MRDNPNQFAPRWGADPAILATNSTPGRLPQIYPEEPAPTPGYPVRVLSRNPTPAVNYGDIAEQDAKSASTLFQPSLGGTGAGNRSAAIARAAAISAARSRVLDKWYPDTPPPAYAPPTDKERFDARQKYFTEQYAGDGAHLRQVNQMNEGLRAYNEAVGAANIAEIAALGRLRRMSPEEQKRWGYMPRSDAELVAAQAAIKPGLGKMPMARLAPTISPKSLPSAPASMETLYPRLTPRLFSPVAPARGNGYGPTRNGITPQDVAQSEIDYEAWERRQRQAQEKPGAGAGSRGRGTSGQPAPNLPAARSATPNGIREQSFELGRTAGQTLKKLEQGSSVVGSVMNWSANTYGRIFGAAARQIKGLFSNFAEGLDSEFKIF